MQKEIMREYDKQGQWENYEAALSTEWTQSVEEGKDLVTLLTCTPYGVNSHRLLVRGHRVPYVPEEVQEEIALLENDVDVSAAAITNNYGMVLGECCTLSRVADLISLMEDGEADTVSEAVDVYRGSGR